MKELGPVRRNIIRKTWNKDQHRKIQVCASKEQNKET